MPYARRLLAIGLLALLCGLSSKAVAKVPPADSLRAVLRRPHLPDTTRIQTTVALAAEVVEQDPPAATRMLEQVLGQARNAHYTRGVLLALNELGRLAGRVGDYPKAQHYLQEAVDLATRTHHYAELGRACYFMGMMLASLSLESEQKIQWLERARDAYAGPPVRDSAWLAISLGFLASQYVDVERMADARRSFHQAMAIGSRLHDQGKATFRILLSWTGSITAQEPDSAAYYCLQAMRLADERLRTPYPRAFTRTQLMAIRAKQGRWAEVVGLSGETISLFRQIGATDQVAIALEEQAMANRHLGRTAQALDTLILAHHLRDSVRSIERTREIGKLQVKFDVAQQQTRIKDLEQQKHIATLEADRQTARNRLLVAVLAALGLLLAGGIYFYLRLRRSKAALAVSEAEARAANATKAQLMSIIGHDLRSPVATFQQVTPLLHHLADAPDPATQREVATALDASAHHLGALLDNLLYWARAEAGSLINHPQVLPIEAVLTEAAAPYAAGAQLKSVLLTTAVHRADDDDTGPLHVEADPDLLRTVLRNLVSNAVKFTPAGGQVRLRAWVETPGQVTIEVRDTGIGIAAERVVEAFGGGQIISTTGTSGEQGTGLGLPLSARFVRLLGSELFLEPLPAGQAGTSFRFRLPLIVNEQFAIDNNQWKVDN